MSSKKTRERQEEALVFLLVLYVMGFAFLYANAVVGITLLGFAFFLTMLAFPPVWKALRTAVKSIMDIAQKRATQANETAENSAHTARTPTQPQPPPPLVTEAQGKSTYDEVVDRLEVWRPPRRFSDERQSEVATEQYLDIYFPNQIRIHKFRENFESDLEIGDIGIEIKVLYQTRELQRLGGQLMAYCEHFNHVIALIFNYNRIDLISYLNQWQKHFGNRVKVIVKEN